MNLQDICCVQLPQADKAASICMMDQEIPGTKVICHVLQPGDVICLAPSSEFVRIMFVCSGDVTITSDATSRHFDQRGVFIGKPHKDLTMEAKSPAQVLELCRWLTADEYAEVVSSDQLPYDLNYADAVRYTEACKSPKTTSREIVPQRLIPRFAMGSVETYGRDRIEQHSHPHLEQYFFSLAENNCIALIDDLQYPFGPNSVLHIPLGSNHGIHLDDEHSCHYLWIDFLLNEEALEYLDTAHTIVE